MVRFICLFAVCILIVIMIMIGMTIVFISHYWAPFTFAFQFWQKSRRTTTTTKTTLKSNKCLMWPWLFLSALTSISHIDLSSSFSSLSSSHPGIFILIPFQPRDLYLERERKENKENKKDKLRGHLDSFSSFVFHLYSSFLLLSTCPSPSPPLPTFILTASLDLT